MTENTSKNNIFEYCAKGKYFVYPLVDIDIGYVHNDTFAYVVLEALLHGVVVITPRLLLFEELYGDAICYIETDDIIPRVELTHTRWDNKNSNFGLPLVDRYVEKLRLLESNKELYNSYVQKGLLLKDKFDNKKVVNVLLDSINAINA
jgi:glycosyltransferase involved in cell wall biosynthesis